MRYQDFYQTKMKEILSEDPRFNEKAYQFVNEAVAYTVDRHCKNGQTRHISGGELLDGIRDLALLKFGPMSLNLLNEWGVYSTMDFGHLVFNMVNKGLLGSQEQDSIEDFRNGYDFQEAFGKPFKPTKLVNALPII